MKKIAAVITALCLLCLAAAAAAETVLTLDDMPAVVIEDENTTVDEAAFQGKWKADKYFVGQTGIEAEELGMEFGLMVPEIRIEDGKVCYNEINEKREPVEYSAAYNFEAGQIQFMDSAGASVVIELLEDGNLVVSMFAGEGDETICISAFMVRAD